MIKINNIDKIYGTGEIAVNALKDVSLSIKPGEFLAIMGPSGSGKSTLMNILGCLDRPTDGEYYLDGTDVSQLTEKKLAHIRNRKIGFIFQTFNLLPRLSALKNVEQPMIYSGINRKNRLEIAKQALVDVGLGDRVDHKPSELSGGQRQRVAIARSLVNEPQIILADEPTGNLDSESEEDILEILKSLNNKDITIVMVTHDTQVAHHAHRIVHFKDGRLIKEEFPPEYSSEYKEVKTG
ncbi:MAG TPA: ABC transporter ATP-binding protein [Halanaerobiales bacterium]|nr:ABC transporter ATP-binding protein [Halanaerobiales bacterium]